MAETILRKATIADLPTLYEFEKGVIFAERPFDETLKEGEIHYYDLEDLISSEDSELLVLEVDKKLVASGYVRIELAKPYLRHDKFGYLGFMFVLPDFRGRGLNRIIVDGLKEWSIEKGIVELRLDVYEQNFGAIRAYEKVGFSKQMVEMRLGLD